MRSEYAEIEVKLKTGREQFEFNKTVLNFDLLSFWRWSGSDLTGNTARGVLAEYIVANALGIAEKATRIEWNAFDLMLKKVKIEVKSSSYLQTWRQRRLSNITFGIQRTRIWNPDNNQMEGDLKRQADVYVFCVLAHKTQESLNPLNLDQWEFYILPTTTLDDNCLEQKTIGLNRIKSFGVEAVRYDQIADIISQLQINRI